MDNLIKDLQSFASGRMVKADTLRRFAAEDAEEAQLLPRIVKRIKELMQTNDAMQDRINAMAYRIEGLEDNLSRVCTHHTALLIL